MLALAHDCQQATEGHTKRPRAVIVFVEPYRYEPNEFHNAFPRERTTRRSVGAALRDLGGLRFW
jgi:hypothetical protein